MSADFQRKVCIIDPPLFFCISSLPPRYINYNEQSSTLYKLRWLNSLYKTYHSHPVLSQSLSCASYSSLFQNLSQHRKLQTRSPPKKEEKWLSLANCSKEKRNKYINKIHQRFCLYNSSVYDIVGNKNAYMTLLKIYHTI